LNTVLASGAARALGSDSRRPFTACGDPRLEERVRADLERCVERLREVLPPSGVQGIVLGGGFGRGEGGVRRAGRELVPYNDYDLFVVTPILPWPIMNALASRAHAAADELTAELGVEVEVALLGRRALLHPPQTLAMADLLSGHRILDGPPDLLAATPGPSPAAIPTLEATKLVLNRSALLVMARGLLPRVHDASIGERVTRYVRKAWLAAGDALLIARRRYDPSPRRRIDILAGEPLPDGLHARYTRASLERLNGEAAEHVPCTIECLAEGARALSATLDEVERRRIGVGIGDRVRYRAAVLADGPATLRDRVRDVRDMGRMAFALPLQGSRTARLLAVLPCVLDHIADPAVHHRPCAWLEPSRLLGVGPMTTGDLDNAFLNRWRSLP
jgi:hypothetical protein